MSRPQDPPASVDPVEIDAFSARAAEWWDADGPFAPLHKFNPVRTRYIRERVCGHFKCDPGAERPFSGLRFLDIGCGGGLLSEPLARLGADVVGADASERNIGTARVHASEQGLEIDYRHTTAEALAGASETFDVVLNMEVVEHVADLPGFISACGTLVRPGGLMIVATLNRTLKAYALAIVGAEYVLRWLPRGTHDWNKFVRPDELAGLLAEAGLHQKEVVGVSYNPLSGTWATGTDTDVNYMLLAEKPEAD